MPPLPETSPVSFYAKPGSEESEELTKRARAGEFDIWDARTPENEYEVFSVRGQKPEIALGALVLTVKDEGDVAARRRPDREEGIVSSLKGLLKQ